MKEEIKVLKQTELSGQQFTVYGTMEEPLFKAKDVTDMLGLKNPREVKRRLKPRGVSSTYAPTYNQHGSEVIQNMNFITEPMKR